MPTPAVANNNPGNLKDPSSGQFMKFSTPQAGYAALLNDLETKKSGKSTTGLTPTSTLVDFAKTYAPASDKNNPGQYAASLATQMGVRPDAQLKDLDTGKWAAAVAHNEDNSSPFGKGQTASVANSGALGGALPPPPDTETAVASTGATPAAPESIGQKAVDVGKGVGNFLFPIAGDIYNDVTGKNTKSGLQQAGDLGLSALPFIPGLGEAGEAARGAEVAGEGAGLVSKLLASSLARNTAVGYGAGVASNLSQGKDIGSSFAPGINTVGGALLGAGGSLASKAIGGLLDTATGIPKNRIPGLQNATPSLYDEYANVGAARAADETKPSLLEHGIEHFKNAVDTMQQNLRGTQAEIGSTIAQEGMKPINDVVPVLKDFQDNLGKFFGKTINVGKDGDIAIENLPGRVKNTLDPEDETRIKEALAQVLSLTKEGNIQKASDVIDNLDTLVNYGKKKYFGATDPLNGFLKQVRGGLNNVLKKSSPALGAAKERASQLHTALQEVEGGAGNNLQRAGLLLKRVLSGDQGRVPREVFNTIKNETGVDLQEHATLIRHFVDSIGDQSEKSALQKMLEESAMKGGTTLTDLGLRGGKSFLQHTVANPVKVGRRLVQGKHPYGIMSQLIAKGRPTRAVLEGARILNQ